MRSVSKKLENLTIYHFLMGGGDLITKTKNGYLKFSDIGDEEPSWDCRENLKINMSRRLTK